MGVISDVEVFMIECFKQIRIGTKIGSSSDNRILLIFVELGNQADTIYKNKILSNTTQKIYNA